MTTVIKGRRDQSMAAAAAAAVAAAAAIAQCDTRDGMR